jgi:hypothetical protein
LATNTTLSTPPPSSLAPPPHTRHTSNRRTHRRGGSAAGEVAPRGAVLPAGVQWPLHCGGNALAGCAHRVVAHVDGLHAWGPTHTGITRKTCTLGYKDTAHTKNKHAHHTTTTPVCFVYSYLQRTVRANQCPQQHTHVCTVTSLTSHTPSPATHRMPQDELWPSNPCHPTHCHPYLYGRQQGSVLAVRVPDLGSRLPHTHIHGWGHPAYHCQLPSKYVIEAVDKGLMCVYGGGGGVHTRTRSWQPS